MSFNPASYAVAGFVDVTNMSRQDRKRIGQNDDEGYGTPEARLGTLAHAAIEATIPFGGKTTPRHIVIQHLEQAAARFALRRDNFAFGKDETCSDLAAKLDRFGSFVSDKQAEFAWKLIGWSAGYGQPHPMAVGISDPVPAKAPASPVAASKPAAQAVTLPKLFDLMQRLSKLTIGAVTIARKNQDSLCWVKLDGIEGVVGKIEGGKLTVFASRMANTMGPRVLVELLTTIEADPEAAAVMHGRLSGRCSVCSRDLTDPESIERGIGPVCSSKAGW